MDKYFEQAMKVVFILGCLSLICMFVLIDIKIALDLLK